MLGKIEGQRRRGRQRMIWLDGITDSWVWVNSGTWWWTGKPSVLQFMGSQRVGHNWVTELNSIHCLLASNIAVEKSRNHPKSWSFICDLYFIFLIACSISFSFQSVVSCSVMSDSVAARLLCPWNFSGKNTGVDNHSLCQGIFLT